MTPGQTEIPGDFAETLGPCLWCGSEAVDMFEVQPSQMGTAKGREVLKHRVVRAPACLPCLTRLEAPHPVREEPDPVEQLTWDLAA